MNTKLIGKKLFVRSQRVQISLVAVMLVMTCLPGFSQDSKSFDLMNDEVESAIPPLSALIDSAIAHNPYVKFRDNQVTINKSKLKTNQLQWTRNLGIQSDIRYGTFNNFNNYTTVAGQSPDIYSTVTTETNYGVGAFLRIPLDEIFNRRNLIKSAKSEIEQAHNMADVQRNELRQLVIKQYNELILKHILLKIKSKYLEISRFNMEMADKDFHSGVMTVYDYSRISELATNAEADFQTTKVDFNTAYLLLEEIVGIKLNLSNPTKK